MFGVFRLATIIAVASLVLVAQHVPGKFLPSSSILPVTVAKEIPFAYDSPVAQVPVQRLPSPSAEELEPRPRNGAKQVGVRRELSPVHPVAPEVIALPAGRIALRLIIQSPGALGLRVHFANAALGTGRLWVYPASSAPKATARVAGPYTNLGPAGKGNFWSAVIDSDEAVVEFDPPLGSSGDTFPFQIDAITHNWDAVKPDASLPATCELDVTCYPAYTQFATGVPVYFLVSDSGEGYECSGALINTAAQAFEPYMITAHHCVSSDTEAQTIVAYFGYQTQTCNGTADLSSATAVEGATYVAGADITQGDYALVLFNNQPPKSLPGYYFGWSATDPAIGDPVFGIHHPYASWARISFGSRAPDETEIISGQTAPSNLFLLAGFTQGVIEPGSSGSPLLNGNEEIVGTATAGGLETGALCSLNPFYALYGRFSAAYPALQPYLNGNPAPSFTVSPSQLSFTVADGAIVGSPSETIVVTPDSSTLVPYSAIAADSWVGLGESTSQLASTSAPGTITISPNAMEFSLNGTYQTSISIAVGAGNPLVVPVYITVANTKSNVVVSVNTIWNSSSQPADILSTMNATGGFLWPFWLNLTESAGVATQITTLKVGSQDLSSELPAILGGTILLPFQSLTGLVIPPVPPPTDGGTVIEVDGTDPTGENWTKQSLVYFLDPSNYEADSFLVSSFPGIVRENGSDPGCPFRQHIALQSTGSDPVSVTAFQELGGTTFSLAQIETFLGSSYLPVGGTLDGDFCWQFSEAFLGYSYITANLGPPSPMSVQLTAAPSSQILTSGNPGASVTINPGSASSTWSANLIMKRPSDAWLTVTPTGGTGPGAIQVAVNSSNLIPGGFYQADLIVQAENSTPQYVTIPFTYQVPSAHLAVVNAATFGPGIAPGSAVSVFDSDSALAAGTAGAPSVPLPVVLASTSVTINGTAAPFFYASATQLNLQIPFEVQPGPATLSISTATGQTLTQPIYINSEAPGIFLTDGHIAPNVSVTAGGYATLYFTGQGYVSPTVATGNAPPNPDQVSVDSLPAPYANVSVYVNGVLAQNSFVGIPYYLVGVTQVNFIVPPDTPSGDQEIYLSVGSTPSNTGLLTVQ